MLCALKSGLYERATVVLTKFTTSETHVPSGKKPETSTLNRKPHIISRLQEPRRALHSN